MSAIDRVMPHLPGWCTPEKANRLARLVREEKALLSVELGVFGGRSLLALGVGAITVGGRAVGVDPYDAVASNEGSHDKVNKDWWSALNYEDIYQQAVRGMRDAGLDKTVTIVRAKSEQAVREFADHSIDVLHQDSNHSEEVSSKEVELWLPKMKPNGFWIMDDIGWTTGGKISTAKAQTMLAEAGFLPVETYETWCIFRHGADLQAGCSRSVKGLGSVGGHHLGGAILIGEVGDANTWLPDIWQSLIERYGVKSVLDVGCGAGNSTRWFEDHGCIALGIEGDLPTFAARKTDSIVLHDFQRGEVSGLGAFDLGWCAEFVEHVEERYMAHWMAALGHCRFVAMTFAVPGQGGYHHVNEQPESYWIERFARFGFEIDREETTRMRATSRGEAWGRPTLTFFRNTRLP